MNIRPKIFKSESPLHHPLRFTQGYGIDQIFMIRKYVYFIVKENPLELIKAFHYCEKLLLSRIVVRLWFDQYY